MKKTFGIPIHKEGRNILLLLFLFLLVLNLILWINSIPVISSGILVVSVLLFIVALNFFRSPKRVFDYDARDIVSPADGKIVVIENTYEGEVLKENRIQISIFMSLFNVHANWFPFDGKVVYYAHKKGNFHAAYLPKASTENESSSVVLKSKYSGEKVLVKQIAGALARRIVTYAYTGKNARFNEYLGFIKFGSRVDMFLPADKVDILLKYGDKTVGNKTVIARWK